MALNNVLSVGYEFDYPLTGGESLYALLSIFNEKFLLNLTEKEYQDQKAIRRNSDNLIVLTAISNDGGKIYNFINMTNTGVDEIIDVPVVIDKPLVITKRPVNFKQELDFLSTVELNTPINYGFGKTKIINNLHQLLIRYEYGNWNTVGENNNNVNNFILRYYGSGNEAPPEYGSYDSKVVVAIIDLKRNGLYSTYCLRTKKYNVYDNGYRSGD